MVKALPDACCSYDGKPLSSIAKRVPTMKPSGNVQLDSRRKMERAAMIKLIDAMTKKTKVIMPLFGYLTSNNLEIEVEDPTGDSESWKGGYKQVDRIPRGWVSEWLLQYANYIKVGELLNERYLTAVAKADSEGVSVLFQLATQLVGTMAMPANMQDECSVASLAFRKRAEERGNYLLDFGKAGGFADPQKLMYSIGNSGCYRLKFSEEGFLVSIMHISGVEGVVPPHLARTITTAFALKDNFLDHMARLELMPSVYFLKDFFPQNSSFKTDMLVKGKKSYVLAASAQLAEEELDALKKQATSSDVTGCGRVLAAAKKQQRGEAMEKARLALQTKKAERLTKRTFNLG